MSNVIMNCATPTPYIKFILKLKMNFEHMTSKKDKHEQVQVWKNNYLYECSYLKVETKSSINKFSKLISIVNAWIDLFHSNSYFNISWVYSTLTYMFPHTSKANQMDLSFWILFFIVFQGFSYHPFSTLIL